ncbi:hypothetical protein P7K49_008308 [Saguinus oedipus]|uniref:Uncharacterized protein n=1 Tax=Saguinus oedipus TaxID=9490 RepID=A0ABQ9VXF7_SAGOE|nr:hypothetical protein P7K49_008308 [Saguinus oedipus]
MSQVLGKPQPQDKDEAEEEEEDEDEEEEEEEEDELVGLADYGDGPDSSDGDPDSGTEEGGERPQLEPLSSPWCLPAPSLAAHGPPTWSGSRGAELRGWGGEGRQKRDLELPNVGARCWWRRGNLDRWGRGRREEASGPEERALLPLSEPVPPAPLTRALRSVWRLEMGGEGTAGAPWDLSPERCC